MSEETMAQSEAMQDLAARREVALRKRNESVERLHAAQDREKALRRERTALQEALAEGGDEKEVRKKLYEIDGELDRVRGEVSLATKAFRAGEKELALANSAYESLRGELEEQDRVRAFELRERMQDAAARAWEQISPRCSATGAASLKDAGHQVQSYELAFGAAKHAAPDLEDEMVHRVVQEQMRQAYGPVFMAGIAAAAFSGGRELPGVAPRYEPSPVETERSYWSEASGWEGG